MKKEAIKVAITGPESTGKSELSKNLAAHYQSVYVPEYARSYIDDLNRPYTQDDILEIAKNQLSLEKEFAAKTNGFLFCDTELMVTRIWSLHKYGHCDPWIDEHIEKNRYDLILLCNIDLPWQFDNQREHPHMRQYFFDWYCSELEKFGFKYFVVSGLGDDRTQNAINIINNHFTSNQ